MRRISNTTLQTRPACRSLRLAGLVCCAVLALCALSAPTSARADNAANQFDAALALLNQAEAARDAGSHQDAIALFEKAFEHYMALSEKYPTWQAQVTRFRMNYAKDQMQLLMRRGGWLAPSDKPESTRNPDAGVADPKAVGPAPAARLSKVPTDIKRRVRELIQLGDARGARAVLLDALMKSPDDLELRLLTATAQCIDGQYEDALFILDELAFEQPQNTDIIILKGAAYTGLGDLDEARKQLEQAIALNGELHEPHFNLAGLFLAQKPPDTDMALAHYERALKLGAQPDEGIAKAVGYGAPVEAPEESPKEAAGP